MSLPNDLRNELSQRLPGRVTWSSAALHAYRQDLWPRLQIRKRFDLSTAPEPLAVVQVTDEADVEVAVQVARAHGVAIIPYGAGSGVVGGTIAVRPSILLDLKRMARLVELDERAHVARVEAGKLGQELETELRARGFTLGHYPSSIHCSTVGGYAATRSAGQFSSRYGKFEDMVEGLRVYTPAEGWLEIDRAADEAAGTALLDAFVGSEGTLGILTRVDVRVHPAPAEEAYRGLAFPTLEDGWAAMRDLLQAGLKPSVLRLYDPFDSIVALKHSFHGDTPGADVDPLSLGALLSPLKDLADGVFGDVQRKALKRVLRHPGVTNRLIEKALKRCALILGFEGPKGQPAADMSRALALAGRYGAEDHGEGPGWHWLSRRHAVSFKQAPIYHLGGFVDTMEVATSWTSLPQLYQAIRDAVGPHVFLMAHFSHAYADGCSIYFTFAGLRDQVHDALALYDTVWEVGPSAALGAGGTFGHHHGVGLLKRAFLPREVENGAPLFARLKATFDPEGLLNPGKLWGTP